MRFGGQQAHGYQGLRLPVATTGSSGRSRRCSGFV